MCVCVCVCIDLPKPLIYSHQKCNSNGEAKNTIV